MIDDWPEGMDKPMFLMTEEELKEKYNGKICVDCGKPFNFKVKKNEDGSETIYPHGVWEARKDWLRRNGWCIPLAIIFFPITIAIGIYLLYYYWRYD